MLRALVSVSPVTSGTANFSRFRMWLANLGVVAVSVIATVFAIGGLFKLMALSPGLEAAMPTGLTLVLWAAAGILVTLRPKTRYVGIGIMIGTISYALFLFLVLSTIGEGLQRFEEG